jgi:hypothetical protein
MKNRKIHIKFVQEGSTVTVYQWTRTFLCFGYWTSVSSTCGSVDKFMDKVDILEKYKNGQKLNSRNFWQ